MAQNGLKMTRHCLILFIAFSVVGTVGLVFPESSQGADPFDEDYADETFIDNANMYIKGEGVSSKTFLDGNQSRLELVDPGTSRYVAEEDLNKNRRQTKDKPKESTVKTGFGVSFSQMAKTAQKKKVEPPVVSEKKGFGFTFSELAKGAQRRPSRDVKLRSVGVPNPRSSEPQDYEPVYR